jgi:hypothetical protein
MPAPTIIFIHGRGLKPPKDVERKNWLDALNRGLTRLTPGTRQLRDDAVHVRIAYWSDLFYPPATQSNADQQTAPAGIVDPTSAGLDDTQATAAMALVDKFWQWRLPQPAAASAAAADPKTAQFKDGFARDVVKFFGLGYADTCAGPLRDELKQVEAGSGVILVSHSFGTVTAYEVLVRDLDAINQDRQQNGWGPLQIDTWVTMGSPLSWAIDLQAELPTWKERLLTEIDQGFQPALRDAGDVLQNIGTSVHDHLAALRQKAQPAPAAALAGTVSLDHMPPKQFPSGVNRWFNVYDLRDPVACEGGLGGLVGGALAVGGTFLSQNQQRAFDITIRNDDCPPEVRWVDIRAHDDFNGYGQCAQLSQVVADCWERFGGQWA